MIATAFDEENAVLDAPPIAPSGLNPFHPQPSQVDSASS